MADRIKIQKPDLNVVDKGLAVAQLGKPAVREAIEKTMSPAYLPWEKVKYRPMPEHIKPEELWFLVKIFRDARKVNTILHDVSGAPFTWVKLDRFERQLHETAMKAGGNILSGQHIVDVGSRTEDYVTRGILEEAIASSQLEGAHTTRKAALKMLREGAVPRNKDEQMILNNYKVIQQIRDTYQKDSMSEDLMLALQRLLTDNTDVDPGDVGRFRTDEDGIVIRNENEIGHIPPPEAFYRKELKRFVDFANDVTEGPYVDPVIKAIMLHFWVGYLHPFADGNGRFARAVFYWYLLKHDYWAIMYLPISVMIKKSPSRYAYAYIYAEQDDLDLTYFIDYHLDVLRMAVDDFNEFLRERFAENKKVAAALGDDVTLNERQKSLLAHLAKHPHEQVTIKNHQTHHNVTLVTARNDLYGLVDADYLTLQKISDHFVLFSLSEKALSLLK